LFKQILPDKKRHSRAAKLQSNFYRASYASAVLAVIGCPSDRH